LPTNNEVVEDPVIRIIHPGKLRLPSLPTTKMRNRIQTRMERRFCRDKRPVTSGDQELPSAGLTADRNREAASKWRVKRKEVAGSRDQAPTKIVQSGRLSILAVAEDRKIPKPTNPHAHLTPPNVRRIKHRARAQRTKLAGEDHVPETVPVTLPEMGKLTAAVEERLRSRGSIRQFGRVDGLEAGRGPKALEIGPVQCIT
jgi:hypothetical protein